MADEAEVTVIRPNVSPEEALAAVDPAEPFDPEDVRFVAHPNYLFDYAVTFDRLFLPDRVEDISVTIDGLHGGGLRNDAYPDLETRSMPAGAVLETRVDREEATENSRSVVRRHVNRQFSAAVIVGNLPEIDLQREDFAYTLYWLVPTKWNPAAETVGEVVSSVSGKVLAADVTLDNVDERTFLW
jgi:hypothetical protein